MRGVERRRRMGGNDINTINTHVGNSPKINLKIKKRQVIGKVTRIDRLLKLLIHYP